jgi:hypothetical protein
MLVSSVCSDGATHIPEDTTSKHAFAGANVLAFDTDFLFITSGLDLAIAEFVRPTFLVRVVRETTFVLERILLPFLAVAVLIICWRNRHL